MPRLASYARNPRPLSAVPVLPASPSAPASVPDQAVRS
ncbi:hypothetical protein SRIMHP_15675 [Streptomyces rimosus subsp. rimosus]|uniref:Uncharacterized protein n=1 Tax=Streptomyces rimosus subsp. rimosus TaxID=132474 RepID=A0ABY3Z1R0_STRRM|nr:hypothetical protein SRIMR7_18040 [Streptomyces rimosus subsp. rimosus]UTH95570.1 hypothetical protein SRIMHP_15675 [Streptomyces rimosus subsp. rimosus]UTJ13667.1 hypothetical protein SRIMDV3_15570 [Streptomyces rimosus subsp. rimosus]